MVSLPTLPEHPLCPNQPHFMSTHLFEHSTKVEGEKQESFKKTLKGTNAYAVLTLTRMIPKKILILKGKKSCIYILNKISMAKTHFLCHWL
jgi:hypothetical protein